MPRTMSSTGSDASCGTTSTSPYYVVVSIADTEIAYQGENVSAAARALTPGTCYGSGNNFQLAFQQARRRARDFRR
jgi:hypothetical protein